jgi:hypothetical protein
MGLRRKLVGWLTRPRITEVPPPERTLEDAQRDQDKVNKLGLHMGFIQFPPT